MNAISYKYTYQKRLFVLSTLLFLFYIHVHHRLLQYTYIIVVSTLSLFVVVISPLILRYFESMHLNTLLSFHSPHTLIYIGYARDANIKDKLSQKYADTADLEAVVVTWIEGVLQRGKDENVSEWYNVIDVTYYIAIML